MAKNVSYHQRIKNKSRYIKVLNFVYKIRYLVKLNVIQALLYYYLALNIPCVMFHNVNYHTSAANLRDPSYKINDSSALSAIALISYTFHT